MNADVMSCYLELLEWNGGGGNTTLARTVNTKAKDELKLSR